MVPCTKGAAVLKDRVSNDSCALPPRGSEAAIVKSPHSQLSGLSSPLCEEGHPLFLQKEKTSIGVFNPKEDIEEKAQFSKLGKPQRTGVSLFDFIYHRGLASGRPSGTSLLRTAGQIAREKDLQTGPPPQALITPRAINLARSHRRSSASR